jgi:mevalonate kinase
MKPFRAHGKLLITGEYIILHGAQALALPTTKRYQELEIKILNRKEIQWQAFNNKNDLWFEATLDLNQMEILKTNNHSIALKTQQILKYIKGEKPSLFANGIKFTTKMNFSPEWGIGSSSTFISLLSQWSNMSPFLLQNIFFGGSGYDVACSTSKGPLIFVLKNGEPIIQNITWSPSFKHNLNFVYLGSKANTLNAVQQFTHKQQNKNEAVVNEINSLTESFVKATNLQSFQNLMDQHEDLISSVLGFPPIKNERFPDFQGSIKSLGAWGGDFVLVASFQDPEDYFREKGYELIFKWEDLF